MAIFKHGFISAGFLNLTGREAYTETAENNAVILDVREHRFTGYKRFDVAAVIYIPFSELEEKYITLPRDIPLIVADTAGLRSRVAIEFLQSKGFENIANLAGGLIDWERDGLPLKKVLGEQLDGSCVCQLRRRHKSKDELK
jgi:rhodanese-related sulfurtransferase